MGEKCVIYVEKYMPRCYLCGDIARYKISFWYFEVEGSPFKSFFLCQKCYDKLREFLPPSTDSPIIAEYSVSEKKTVKSSAEKQGNEKPLVAFMESFPLPEAIRQFKQFRKRIRCPYCGKDIEIELEVGVEEGRMKIKFREVTTR